MKVLRFLLISSFLVALVFILDWFLPRNFQIPENIISIYIKDGQTGKEVTVTDIAKIQELREIFSKIKTKRIRFSRGLFGGYHFHIQALSASGTVTSILVMTEECINGTHKIVGGTVDTEYLKQLCNAP